MTLLKRGMELNVPFVDVIDFIPRDMIAGSKRRKEKETRPQSVGEMDVDAGQKEYR